MSTRTVLYFLAALVICWTPVTSRSWRTEDSYFSSRNQIANPYRQNSFSSGSQMPDHFSRSPLAGPRGQNFFYSESCKTGPDGRTLCSSSTSRNKGPIKRNHFSSGSQRASSNGYRQDPLSLRNLMTGPYGQSLFSSSGHRKESSKWEPSPSRSPITGLYNQNLILPYGPNPSNLRRPVPGSLSQRQSPYSPKEGINRHNPLNLRSRIQSSYEKSQYSSRSQMIQPFTKPYAQKVPSTRSHITSPYGQNRVNLRNPVAGRRRNQYTPNIGPYTHSEQSRYSSKSQMTQQSFSSRNPFAEQNFPSSGGRMTRPYRKNPVNLRNPTPGSQNPDLHKQSYDITDSRSRKQNGHAFTSRATRPQKQNFANRSGLISGASTSSLASNQNQSSSKRQVTGNSKQTVANSVKPKVQKSNPYPRKS